MVFAFRFGGRLVGGCVAVGEDVFNGLGSFVIVRYTVKRHTTEKPSTMEDHLIFIPSSEREALQSLYPAS